MDEDVEIGEGTKTWHFCHIQKGARIGKRCSLGQNVNVSNHVKVGDGCKLQNNVSLYEGVGLVPFDQIPKVDCVIVAVGHNEFYAMSMMQLKELYRSELPNEERVLIDAKSLYRMDELRASGLRFWRL